MTQSNMFNEIQDKLKEEIKKAYWEGANKGSVSTCAVIYETMRRAGLEEDNFLFMILIDIAKQHGCEDLPAVAADLRNRASNNSNSN